MPLVVLKTDQEHSLKQLIRQSKKLYL